MKRIIFISVSLLLCTLFLRAARLGDFRVNRMSDPAGMVGTANFGWQVLDTDSGVVQTAYCIRVANSKEGLQGGPTLMWNSEQVKSGRCQLVPYQGRRLPSGQEVWWQVQVWLSNGEQLTGEAQHFTCGLKQKDWKAQWISASRGKQEKAAEQSARYLRKVFTISHPVRRAVLFVSSVGTSQCFLNGKTVTSELTCTLPSDYNRTVYFNTYDVTALLNEGHNCMGVILGTGSAATLPNYTSNNRTPIVKAQLRIETEQDTVSLLTDNTWCVSTDGPIRQNTLSGLTYDASREMNGWSMPGYDDAGWAKATVMRAPMGPVVSQPCKTYAVVDSLCPQVSKVRKSGKGVYAIFLDHPVEGLLKATLKGKAEQPVTFVYSDGSQDVYIPRDNGPFVWQPFLNTHYFNKVEVKGLTSKPKINDIQPLAVADSTTLHNPESSLLIKQLQDFCDTQQDDGSMPLSTPAFWPAIERSIDLKAPLRMMRMLYLLYDRNDLSAVTRFYPNVQRWWGYESEHPSLSDTERLEVLKMLHNIAKTQGITADVSTYNREIQKTNQTIKQNNDTK